MLYAFRVGLYGYALIFSRFVFQNKSDMKQKHSRPFSRSLLSMSTANGREGVVWPRMPSPVVMSDGILTGNLADLHSDPLHIIERATIEIQRSKRTLFTHGKN